ncbi:MAG TPA: PQ-loop repeat-containing protein [Acidimicrobiia bacterium]
MFEVLGMAGIGLSVVAYLPQVSHLAKEHCSAGISPRAWTMWLASSLLVGALAVYRRDYVFISLAASSLLSSTAILLLSRRYRGMACGTHRYPITQPIPR